MCPYLIREGEGAVNVQPVVSLQLQQRVSQQLLEEQRECERSGVRTAAVLGGQQKEGAADVGQGHRFQEGSVRSFVSALTLLQTPFITDRPESGGCFPRGLCLSPPPKDSEVKA